MINNITTQIHHLRVSLWLLLFLYFTPVKAQFVDLGQDPASTRWRQIKTEHFQIIYPAFFEQNAQYLANIYEKLYAHANSLGSTPKKMSMIVRANGGIANGNAGWAPKKSELYTSPSQETTDAWLEHLCVHEFRHIVQYDKVNQGFTRTLYYLFGEQITMAVVGLYIPMWYLEGDATDFETSVLPGGRGRSPEFLNQMKAQIVEKGLYPYDKAVLGSYKDFVPNRYVLGYFLVGNSRVNYGNRIWQNALARVGQRPLGITPFANSLQQTLNQQRDSLWNTPRFQSIFVNPDSVKTANTYNDAKRTLYRDNFSELQQVWEKEATTISHTFDTIPTRNPAYTNYHYPTPYQTNSLITYKEGLGEAGAFVLLENAKEQLIFRPGTLYDYKFALNHQTLVWSEYKPHPRWEHGGRMTLASYHLATRHYRRHSAPANRYAPFVVNNNWGFVEVDKNDNASLVIMDQDFQQELFRLTGKPHELFVHPTFDGEAHIITVVVSPAGKWLERINMQTGERTPITPVTHYEIDHPVALTTSLIYRSAFNGNNALYAQTTPLTFGETVLNSRFGISTPTYSPLRDTLYFSFYTSDGYKPGKIALHKLQTSPIDTVIFPTAQALTALENWSFSLTTDSSYTSRKYNKATHLFNPHSWGPIFPDRESSTIDLGIAVSSQNKLSTLYFTAGYVLDQDYPHGNWQLLATYKGWWPVFNLEWKSGRQDDFARIDYQAIHLETGRKDTVYILNDTRRTELTLNLQLPFTWNTKNYYRGLTPYLQYELQNLRDNRMQTFAAWNTHFEKMWTHVSPAEYTFDNSNVQLQILQYGLSFYNQTRMSDRDLYPRWGQSLHGGYAHTPWENVDYGGTWWGEARFYLPGLALHHSLSLYGAHQQKSDEANYYSNKIQSPRGMKLSGHRLSTLRTSYTLPLAYPDTRIGPLLYLKRLSGTLFFDAGQEKNRQTRKTYYSYGLEALFDTHCFRLPFPVNLGTRIGYESRQNSLFVDLLFSITFSL